MEQLGYFVAGSHFNVAAGTNKPLQLPDLDGIPREMIDLFGDLIEGRKPTYTGNMSPKRIFGYMCQINKALLGPKFWTGIPIANPFSSLSFSPSDSESNVEGEGRGLLQVSYFLHWIGCASITDEFFPMHSETINKIWDLDPITKKMRPSSRCYPLQCYDLFIFHDVFKKTNDLTLNKDLVKDVQNVQLWSVIDAALRRFPQLALCGDMMAHMAFAGIQPAYHYQLFFVGDSREFAAIMQQIFEFVLPQLDIKGITVLNDNLCIFDHFSYILIYISRCVHASLDQLLDSFELNVHAAAVVCRDGKLVLQGQDRFFRAQMTHIMVDPSRLNKYSYRQIVSCMLKGFGLWLPGKTSDWAKTIGRITQQVLTRKTLYPGKHWSCRRVIEEVMGGFLGFHRLGFLNLTSSRKLYTIKVREPDQLKNFHLITKEELLLLSHSHCYQTINVPLGNLIPQMRLLELFVPVPATQFEPLDRPFY